MKSENAKTEDFKENVLQDIEALLQFSLWPTEDGHDASRLMRESMQKAYDTWDELSPEESSRLLLHKLLTMQFFNGFQKRRSTTNSFVADGTENIDHSLIPSNRLIHESGATLRQPPIPSDDSSEELDCCKAIASLPPSLRTAMILSSLGGFSNQEIAELAQVEPQAVESLLNRGRLFLREELFAHRWTINSRLRRGSRLIRDSIQENIKQGALRPQAESGVSKRV
jgi:RNA polymerase sigma-70 factor (ECF subfamily)